ncbi:MAG: tail fiber protein [Bacteroidota bacterium]
MDAFLTLMCGWGPNWAPRGWAECNGQLLAISQFTAVFSLIGTIYGGDGRTTFALPEMRGRVPVKYGSGPGLMTYPIGARSGTEFVTLSLQEMPIHSHSFNSSGLSGAILATNVDGDSEVPGPNKVLAKGTVPAMPPVGANTAQIYSDGTPNTSVGGVSISGSGAIGNNGGSQSHENRMPFQVMNWIFCLQGIFPSRN